MTWSSKSNPSFLQFFLSGYFITAQQKWNRTQGSCTGPMNFKVKEEAHFGKLTQKNNIPSTSFKNLILCGPKFMYVYRVCTGACRNQKKAQEPWNLGYNDYEPPHGCWELNSRFCKAVTSPKKWTISPAPPANFKSWFGCYSLNKSSKSSWQTY